MTNYSFTISDTHLGATKKSGVISDNIYSKIYNASDPKSEGSIERGLKHTGSPLSWSLLQRQLLCAGALSVLLPSSDPALL